MVNKGKTLAIGTVYMGVQKSNDANSQWNDTIYKALGKDIDELESLDAMISVKVTYQMVRMGSKETTMERTGMGPVF